MEEKVDIIDGNNRIVGVDTRENAHLKGLLHRCVIAELKDENGNFIFVKQAPHMQDKGQLASAAGGHILSGESNEQALKREVFEELGVKDFKYSFKGEIIFKRNIEKSIENHFFVIYEISSDNKIVLNEESDGYERLSVKEIKALLRKEPGKFGDALIYIFKHLYREFYKV